MYFTITTNREVAEQIEKQCMFEKNNNTGRSYELVSVTHTSGYSQVKIKPKAITIKPEDIFWLGRFSVEIK